MDVSMGVIQSEDLHDTISLKTTLRYMMSDLDRYRTTDGRSYLVALIICPGAIAGIYYRIGHWLWNYQGIFAWSLLPLRAIYIVMKRLVEVYTGISISPHAIIGPGLYINHFGSIFVNDVVIGENCNLSQEVTIGVAGRGEKRGTPTIGDRVYFAAGVKVIGKLTIGDDVAIGANAVVTKSLPDCAVAVGIPAQIISYNGSFDYVIYRSMDQDPKRLANLAHLPAEPSSELTPSA